MCTSQCPLFQTADPGCGNVESDPASLNSFKESRRHPFIILKENKKLLRVGGRFFISVRLKKSLSILAIISFGLDQTLIPDYCFYTIVA